MSDAEKKDCAKRLIKVKLRVLKSGAPVCCLCSEKILVRTEYYRTSAGYHAHGDCPEKILNQK